MPVSDTFKVAKNYCDDKNGDIKAYHSRIGLSGSDNLHYKSKGNKCLTKYSIKS